MFMLAQPLSIVGHTGGLNSNALANYKSGPRSPSGLVACNKAEHDHNDRERDSRRDQTQLSGGGSGVVPPETHEELFHN